MKRLFIYAALTVFSLSSCKKDPTPVEPKEDPGPNPIPGGGGGGNGDETIPANADIYILGGKFSSGPSTYALWAESTIKESFIDYSLQGLGLEGIFIQENAGTRTVHFFGSKLISQTDERITYFNKKDYVMLSNKLNLPIQPGWGEAFPAYTRFNDEAFLLAGANMTDWSYKRYYYKIDRAGNPTVHYLLPNNNDYKFIAASSSGVYLSHYEAKLFWTDVYMYRENNSLGSFRIELPDFSFVNPHDMVMVNDHTAGFLCTARYDPTSATEYLYVMVDLNSKEVKSIKLNLPIGFHIGNLTVNGNSVLLDGYRDNDKTAYYYQMAYNSSGLFVIQKIPLATNGTSIYTTGDIYISGQNVYISGKEDNTPCYWKNGSIVRLQTGMPSTNIILYDIRK